MGSSPDTVSLAQLDSLVQSAQALIQQILATTRSLTSPPSTTTSPPGTPTPSPAPPAANPLALARDSAALIRADVTKLSLLIINEPFSPSAITPLLTSLLRPLLALLSALQACHPSLYTTPFRDALTSRVQRLLSELASFLAKIPSDGKALTGVARDGGSSSSSSSAATDRGSIPATGLVWAACDILTSLANLGVNGFLAQRIAEWKDTLDDNLLELKEWSEQDPDDDDDDDSETHDDAHSADGSDDDQNGMQRLLDDLMAQKAIPADDPLKIRPRLDTTIRSLRMVSLLYQATLKRRIKRLPPLPISPAPAAAADPNPNANGDANAQSSTITHRLDQAILALRKLPDSFGDLTAALYEMRPDAIDDAMAQCFREASAASEPLANNWAGAADEFTQWTEKFRSEINKDVK